jgi:hypothetical protein
MMVQPLTIFNVFDFENTPENFKENYNWCSSICWEHWLKVKELVKI